MSKVKWTTLSMTSNCASTVFMRLTTKGYLLYDLYEDSRGYLNHHSSEICPKQRLERSAARLVSIAFCPYDVLRTTIIITNSEVVLLVDSRNGSCEPVTLSSAISGFRLDDMSEGRKRAILQARKQCAQDGIKHPALKRMWFSDTI